jgi:large subunit ribosomal protein L24
MAKTAKRATVARPRLHIKKGDRVTVIAGNHKGQSGVVKAVFPKKQRVTVEGVNLVKRVSRPTTRNQNRTVVENEAPIHASNVRLEERN